MSLADCLSRLKQRLSFRRKARQRWGNPLSHFAAQVSLSQLEDRCLLSSSVLGTEVLVNTAVAGTQEAHPAVAVNKAGTVITAWAATDAAGAAHIEARMLSWATPDDTNRDGIQLQVEFQVSMTTGKGIGDPSIAISGNGQFVVTWESQANGQDQNGSGVFARVFAVNGSPLTDEFRVNSTTPGHQTDPSVAWVSPGEFVVVWSTTTQNDVLARLFQVSGAPDPAHPDEFRVPSSRAGTQQHPEVISLPQTAALPTGGFQVAWSGQGAGDLNGIFSRQFKADGTPVAPQFRVNTARAANETHPVMGRDGSKQVVIAWQAVGNGLDRTGSGVVARTFDLSGKGLGTEFLVNETKERNQAAPSVAFLPDGGFVVAWRGSEADGTPAIYQREFADNTAPRFGERLVNTTAAGAHNNPEVRAQGPDGYIIAWDGNINGRRIQPDAQGRNVANSFPDSQGIGLRRYGDPFLPGNTKSSLTEVLYTSNPGVASQVPLKTITLTNNTQQTIYPILRAANSAGDDKDKTVAKYDPADPLNQEYRGYIGYTDPATGQVYVGLLAGRSITVQVPLVFWDASRIYIASDAEDMFPAVDNRPEIGPAQRNSPNPFRYHEFNQDTPADRAETTARFAEAANSGGNGMILWYHGRGLKPVDGPAGLAEDVTLDAPVQLAEFTIRDPVLATINPNLAGSKDLGPLINYDVSYVDSMVLPVAMAATGINKRDGKDVPAPNDYGWIGASLTVGDMQKAIAAFTDTDKNPTTKPNSLLGQYFDGKGYPEFFNPDQSISGIKVPAGQNVFNLSPFADKRSAYDPANDTFMLTSGVAGPVELFLGSSNQNTSDANYLLFDTSVTSPFSYKDALLSIAQGLAAGRQYQITSSGSDLPSGVDTFVDFKNHGGVELVNGQPTGKVYLTQTTKAPHSPTGYVYNFKSPVTDYASTKIMNLWYSWADYYVKHRPTASGGQHAGFIKKGGNVLTFGTAANPALIDKNQLVVGMQVGGTGLPNGVGTDPNAPQATIVEIILDPTDNTKAAGVKLSKLASGDSSDTYTFTAPRQIIRSSEVKTSEIALKDPAQALAFSRVVYLVMDSFSTVPKDPAPGRKESASLQIMENVIGCNIGYVPNIGVSEFDSLHPFNFKSSGDVANAIRDAVKSVMRGVADFTTDQEKDGHWYPDPGLQGKDSQYGPGTGQTIDGKPAAYNVLNLNPFVWFVHKELGLSGYGFSVDDDVADVGANESKNLVVAVGGLQGLPLADSGHPEWSFGAPYGPQAVAGTPSIDNSGTPQDPKPDKIILATGPGDPNYAKAAEVFLKVSATDKANGVVGALVNGPGVRPGTRVAFRNGEVGKPGELSFTLSQKLDAATAQPGTYSFFGPVTGAGSVKSFQKNAVKIEDDGVFKQLLIMATGNVNLTTKTHLAAPGALVINGPGVPKPTNDKPFTYVTSIDPVNKVVELSQNLARFGEFDFTFS